MSHCEKVIAKLPDASKAKLEHLKEEQKFRRNIGNKSAVQEVKCTTLGYIQCLGDMGIISPRDRQILNIYYALF